MKVGRDEGMKTYIARIIHMFVCMYEFMMYGICKFERMYGMYVFVMHLHIIIIYARIYMHSQSKQKLNTFG